jgi:hypothetical protein
MIFSFGGLKWAQSFDLSPKSLARLQRMPTRWAESLGAKGDLPPFEWDSDGEEPQTERRVSGSWYFRLVWTTKRQKTTPDGVSLQDDGPESPVKTTALTGPFKGSKRSRQTWKHAAIKPTRDKAPTGELGKAPSDELGEDVRPAPDPSSFQDDLFLDEFCNEPVEFVTATMEYGRNRSLANGYTPPPTTATDDDDLFEFVKEESCGGPFETTKSMSGFRRAKHLAMEEARLRGMKIDESHEVQLNVRGRAQLARPVVDKTGTSVTPTLHIYQIFTS